MNEATRMDYLEAMGIEMFVPRRILPAAQLPSVCQLPVEWVDDAQLEVVGAESLASGSEPLHSGATLSLDAETTPAASASLVDRTFPVDRPSPAAPTAKSASSSVMQTLLESTVEVPQTANIADPELTLQKLVSQKPKSRLRFSLSVWVLENGVIIIDARSPQAALPTPTLFHNMMSALAPGVELPKADIIQWPLLESAIAVPNEKEEASAMVQAFLKSRLEQLQEKNIQPTLIVAMGNIAAAQLLPPQESYYEIGQLHTSAISLDLPIAVLPSLTELLKEPTLKRHIWPLVKPFF